MFNPEVDLPVVRTVSPPEPISDPEMDDCWSDPDEPLDSLGAPGSPAITSRLSVQKIYSVVSRFCNFKRTLVREIGFQGALETKPWQKLNLKLSAWLLDRVDVETSTLNIEGRVPVGIFDQDVQRVFTLPCGKTTIGHEGVEPSEACIEYSRFAANFSDKGSHSLKAAEAYLNREINEESTPLEIECFKIAFVIFIVGHMLAPSAKHDYITIDFWCALNDMSRMTEWNWCGYVLKHLFAAVKKFKADVAKRNTTIHLIGDHLFLQIMLFDMAAIELMPIPQDVLPRIGVYDYETMKKIVDAITVIDGGDTSFHGGHQKNGPTVPTLVGTPVGINAKHNDNMHKKVQMLCSPMLRASYGKTGANDFSNYIKTKYPSIAGEKLGILLREQNARSLINISEMRQNNQMSMFNFVDKLMAIIAENCTCCKSAGRRQCVLKVTEHVAANPYRTPLADKTLNQLGATPERAESSAASSPLKRHIGTTSSGGLSSVSCKQRRIQVAQPQFDGCADESAGPMLTSYADGTRISFSGTEGFKPPTPLAAKIIRFMDDVASSIVTIQAELRLPKDVVLFGQTTAAIPTKVDVLPVAFARSPWSLGSCPPGPTRTATGAVKDRMLRAEDHVLRRHWILHPLPRFVALDGTSIVEQLLGKKPMSHEMFVVIIRRMEQIDHANTKDTPRAKWRKFVEPDFATAVLSNADPMSMQSVHDLFAGYHAKHDIASTRMWYVPAILEDGWVLYLYDMLRKRIDVLDPAGGPFGFNPDQVKIHEYVSTKILGAIFTCIGHFFNSWPCTVDNWTRAFPIIMMDKFTRDEFGLCASFIAKHYDGDRLVTPLNHENLATHQENILYDVLRLEGNNSALPSDALEAIKNSIFVL